MAEQTTSSIEIKATPGEVKGVIADFAAYPQWAQGVKSAVVVEQGEPGRRSKVAFELEQKPISDALHLVLCLGCRMTPWSGLLSKARRSRRFLMVCTHCKRPRAVAYQVTYRLSVDIAIPMIERAALQGREGHRRLGSQGLKKRV
ncbi:MAG: SRPBCC family protein [Marmoricola sp.]